MSHIRQQFKTRDECPLHHDKAWQWLPGFEDRFMVSSCGDIRRHQSYFHTDPVPRIQQQTPSPNGYLQISIQTNGKRKAYYVHRLVLRVFAGEPQGNQQGAHLDGQRTNNHASNLQWVTSKENHAHKHRHGTCKCGGRVHNIKIPPEAIPHILEALAQGVIQRILAAQYGVTQTAISAILRGKRRIGCEPSPLRHPSRARKVVPHIVSVETKTPHDKN